MTLGSNAHPGCELSGAHVGTSKVSRRERRAYRHPNCSVRVAEHNPVCSAAAEPGDKALQKKCGAKGITQAGPCGRPWEYARHLDVENAERHRLCLDSR